MTIASRANPNTESNKLDTERFEGDLLETMIYRVVLETTPADRAKALASLLLEIQGGIEIDSLRETINSLDLAAEFCYLYTEQHGDSFKAWREGIYPERDREANRRIGEQRRAAPANEAAQPEEISRLVEQIISVVNNPLLPATLADHFGAGLTQLTNEHEVNTDHNPAVMRAWLPDAIAKENQEVEADAKS